MTSNEACWIEIRGEAISAIIPISAGNIDDIDIMIVGWDNIGARESIREDLLNQSK